MVNRPMDHQILQIILPRYRIQKKVNINGFADSHGVKVLMQHIMGLFIFLAKAKIIACMTCKTSHSQKRALLLNN